MSGKNPTTDRLSRKANGPLVVTWNMAGPRGLPK